MRASLPDVDGRELCRLIKACTGPVDTFTALLLCDRPKGTGQPAAPEASVDEYIVCPIARRALLARLRNMLSQRAAREAVRRTEEQLRHRLGETSALNAALQQTSLELLSERDLQKLLENIVRRAGQLMGTDSGFIDLVDPGGRHLKPRVGLGALADSLKFESRPGEGVAGTVWQSGKPLVIDDYDRWQGRVKEYQPGMLTAVAGVPLISAGKVVGVLGLGYSPPSMQSFGPEAIQLLEQFAYLAAIAIENARLFSAQQQELAERRRAEEQVKKLNAMLELRVVERTTQLQAANRELEAFSYSVSHDLRAPLRGIDGWSQALQEDFGAELDEKARGYLERVRSETRRMGLLIDDLLKLSHVTRGGMEFEPVDLSALARAITERLKEELGERQVEFIIQDGLTAQGDSRLLEIALTNLFSNSLKFSEKRPLTKVEFGMTLQDRREVYFVRDNGVGFDMTYAGKLFGAFQRMHSESEFPGTGIGLATVQRIVHRHGGMIWADAQPDAGAVFYFTLAGVSQQARDAAG